MTTTTTVFLWALDFDRDDWPDRSHPIVRIDGQRPHRRYVTACERTYYEGQRGCWSTPVDDNPLPTLACSACAQNPEPTLAVLDG